MSDVFGTEIAVEVAAGDISLRFATGQLAKQADGAVLVTSADTVVLSTVVGAQEARPGADFFPLTVDVEEKMYAAGKIPGGFFKREGKATEKATLNARMIDRPIRPLFPKGFRNEVQVIGTVLSVDMIVSHDILAMNGASAALMISPLPFAGPVGAVRVGLIDGELRVNPSMPDMLESDLDLIVCGTPEAITMVEAGANIVAEDKMVEALELAHTVIKDICVAQLELQQKAGKPKWYSEAVDAELDAKYGASFDAEIAAHGISGVEKAQAAAFAAECPPVAADATDEIMVRRTQVKFALGFIADRRRAAAVKAPVQEQFGDAIKALSDAEQDSKELKAAKRSALIERIVSEIKLPFPSGAENGLDAATAGAVKAAIDSVYKQIVRTKIAVDKRRPDGRGENEIRPIAVVAGAMPRTHGSAIFTRGQTQALTLVTLGTMKEEQRIDDLSLENTKRYIHHYNFPPFSVGETGFMRGPKRRDIGHGALAERALVPVVPPVEDFAYTMRAVSEILESNGSSSMASVCGSSLALMDAGVPIKAPVAGIAMGLIKEGDSLVILTDIQGAEDHLGDMDFKVAGTAEGITALQMDIKITGVTRELLKDALSRAKDARLSILGIMATAIASPRESLSEHAPQVLQTTILPEQIGLLIGKGGETIRGLQEEFSVQIDVEEDGSVRIYGVGQEAVDAKNQIDQMMRPVQVGDQFTERKVVKTADFGAFVELRKGTDGLLHVSRIAPGTRISSADQVLDRGDLVNVEVTEVDTDRGRIGLKLVAKIEDGAEVSPETIGERYKEQYPDGGGDSGRDRGDRGDRGGRRDRREVGNGELMRPGVEVTELASGLRVASEFRPDVHGVALGSWIRVGSRDEEAHDAGVSHLLEHLLFRGTARHDALSIAEAFDRFGSDLAASTSREETDLNARVLAEHLPEAIDIVGSMVACPEFNDIEPEREVVLEELALYEDTPDDLVHDILGETLFPEQAIGRPIAGTAGTVERIDESMIRAHHARHYTGDQVVVAVAGPVEHRAVLDLVEASFAGLGRGVVHDRSDAVAAKGAIAFTERDTEQTHIAIGGAGIGRKDERRFALAVLDQILGGGAASRFWQEIREQRGLVYSVYTYVSYFEESGQIGLALGTRPENLEEALSVAGTEILELSAGNFRPGEIERARDNLKARLLLNMDSTVARMSRLGRSLISDIPLMDDAEVARRIDAVTADDVQGLMQELYAPEVLCVSGIGSDRAAFDRAMDAFRQPVGGAA